MAQIFWEQIRDQLPDSGKAVTGSLFISGGLGITGSLDYNGTSLEDLITGTVSTATLDWDNINNLPNDLFTGSFTGSEGINVEQNGQYVTFSLDLAYINEGEITAVLAGEGLEGGGESGELQFNIKTSTLYGTEIINDTVGIATGSFKFIEGVQKAGLFKQTGSYWSTENDIKITGSLDIDFNNPDKELTITSGSTKILKVSNEGVVELKEHEVPPNARSGSIYYGKDDTFYFGFKN